MKQGKTIFGILAGLAAGALLGVLFAPRKGKETREKIVEKGKKTFDDLKEKVENAGKKFTENNSFGI